MREEDALIAQYTHESHRPRADVALETLRKITSMVKPIMRQRGWRVGILSEFYPEQQNLLGLNCDCGQRIYVRLRYPQDESLFLPFEEIIDIMLHELTHNVFGPHDEKFHRLWNELRADYEALVRKGYTGEGFLSAGKKLGGSGVHPIHEARRLARAAAEKRGLKSAPGPRRIGGAPPSDGVDIRKTIADAAQHRRDTLKGCGNTDAEPGWKAKVLEETKRNEIQTDAGIDDADMRAIEQAFIEMLQEDEELRAQSSLPFSPSRDALSERKLDDPPNLGEMGPPSRPSKSKPAVVSPSTTSNPQTSRCTIGPQVSGDVHENGWTCQICTFENPETFLCCEVCLIDRHSGPAAIDSIPDHDSERPRSVRSGPNQPPGDHKILRSRSSATNIARFEEAEAMRVNSKPVGWTCHCCGTFMETHWWTCSQCGTMKLNS